MQDDFNLTGLSAQARLLWRFNFLFLFVGRSENGLYHVLPCYTILYHQLVLLVGLNYQNDNSPFERPNPGRVH